jgi:hypothetical protein
MAEIILKSDAIYFTISLHYTIGNQKMSNTDVIQTYVETILLYLY